MELWQQFLVYFLAWNWLILSVMVWLIWIKNSDSSTWLLAIIALIIAITALPALLIFKASEK